jgi:hypothetical protein
MLDVADDPVDEGGRAKSVDVQRQYASQGTQLPIYVPPHHYEQRRKPRIPNGTSDTIPREVLFLSTGGLVFRHVGSGRTSRSTNG